ncbi:uncharacterized protein F4822DRAFT_405777 [Hypoxylon trugodes]|uniref:uncharacterized protein n=1 Tax=Hypoxylon trugodes TaxID=326681 RepID=UPI00219F00FF|nr:uncharacterized protein F4822DRAFT_405777 [Hypoxylon trugodes]KAI1387216.1 hypothetical protein F4822DRAFT_405777 [Hypoxylon trugodes]
MADLSSLTSAELDQYLDKPALDPPDNIIPNFDDPPNKNYAAKVLLPLCLAITTIAILFRVYAKLFCVKKFEFPDILMLIGFGCYVTDIYFGYRLLGNTGVFVHQWDIRWKDMADAIFPIFISGSFYIGVIMTIKAAILLDWIQVFIPYGIRDRFFWLCYGVLGANTVFYIIHLFLMNFACTPVEKNWNPLFDGGSCHIDIQVFKIATATVNLFSDIIMFLLPQQVIWNLKLPTRTKTGVIVICAFGLLCCIAAGFRLGSEVKYTRSDDQFYHTTPILLWALVEITCLFVVFGVPSLARILTDVHLPTSFGSPLLSVDDRFTRRPLSKISKISSLRSSPWAGSGMIIKHTRGPSSHTFYRKINNGRGGMMLTTIDSSRGPAVSDSMEGLRDETLQHGITRPEAGVIIRTTQFVRREEFGNYERSLSDHSAYDRQHPWAKDRI